VGVGVGLEEAVLEVGSTRQLVSVLALALVEVPGLGEAAGLIAPACAVPGRPASTPRVRKPLPSTLSAVTRTCARRIRIACLRYSSGCCLLVVGSEATRGRMGINDSYPVKGSVMRVAIPPIAAGPP
jgi:hypothetical protein